MICSTENVLYVLTCMGCNEDYMRHAADEMECPCTMIISILIGNTLMERVHIKQVLHPEIIMCPASRHIDICAFHLPIPNKIMLFFKVNYSNPTLRDSKQKYFIKLTKAKLNGSYC